MGVTNAADFGELFRVAGGRDGNIVEGDDTGETAGGVEQFEADTPTGFAGGRSANGEIAAGRDQRLREAFLAEDAECFFGGVTLGDTAEVELHGREFEEEGFAARVEDEMAIAGASLGIAEGGLGGETVLFAGGPPKTDHGTLGDVEGAVGGAGKALGGFEEHEQIVTDGDWFLVGRAAGAVQFAVFLVIGEGGVEGANAGKRMLEGAAGGGQIAGVHRHAEERSHDGFGGFDAFKFRRGKQGGREQDCGEQHRGLVFFFDAVVPVAKHFFGGGKFQGADEAEAEPLRVGVVPDAFGKLRVLHFPAWVGGDAGAAAEL